MNEDIEKSMDEEELIERRIRFENEDLKADAQRRMTWFSIISMLAYPLFIFIADIGNFKNAITSLTTIAPAYFMSVAGIVGMFFAKEGYEKGIELNLANSSRLSSVPKKSRL